ncbi:MAG: response regulator [Parachlamydiales bacterium]|nr:response regulator [Parachlamydiales bacterium]
MEDDLDISYIVQLILEKENVELNICNSGIKALEQVLIFKPDIILLDVFMPGMSGLDVLEQLHKSEQTASIPIIFITANIQNSEVERFKYLGAAGVIFKPFDPLNFFAQIQKIWGTIP